MAFYAVPDGITERTAMPDVETVGSADGCDDTGRTSSFFGPCDDDEPQRQFRVAELAEYDGSKPDVPIYVALLGEVYDVTPGRKFYGPGLFINSALYCVEYDSFSLKCLYIDKSTRRT